MITVRAGRSRVIIPAGPQDFSSFHNFQTGCRVHPAFYLVSSRDTFHGDKAARA